MILENEEEHVTALSRIDTMWDNVTDENEVEFNTLVDAVVAYEELNYPIDAPTREGYLEFCIDQEMVPDMNYCMGLKKAMEE